MQNFNFPILEFENIDPANDNSQVWFPSFNNIKFHQLFINFKIGGMIWRKP